MEVPEGSIPNGNLGMEVSSSSRLQGLKRPAGRETSPMEADMGWVSKRTRAEVGATSGVRNPIEASFSSSRRWLDRQVGVGTNPLYNCGIFIATLLSNKNFNEDFGLAFFFCADPRKVTQPKSRQQPLW